FALALAERNALQPVEATDAVVDVHDVVADLQIAQIGREGIGRALFSADARRCRRLEKIPLRIRGEMDVVEVEAAAQHAGSDLQADLELLQQALDFLVTPFGGREENLPAIARSLDVGRPFAEAIRVAIHLRRVYPHFGVFLRRNVDLT